MRVGHQIATVQRGTTKSPFWSVRQWLMRSQLGIPDYIRRADATRLTSLIVISTGLHLALVSLGRLSDRSAGQQPGSFLVAASMLVWLIAFTLIRSGRFRFAVVLSTLAIDTVIVALLVAEGRLADSAQLNLLLLPLLLAGILLRSQPVIVFVLGNVVALSLLPEFMAHVAPISVLHPLNVLLLVAVLSLLITRLKTLFDTVQPAQGNARVFNTVISNIPVILFVFDCRGIVTLLEGTNLTAIGRKPGEFIGHSIFEMYNEFPQVLEDCRRALTGDTFVSMAEMFGWAFDVWYSPIRGQNGEVEGVVGVAIDVTERKQAEDMLQYQVSLLHSVSDAIISLGSDLSIQTWNEAAERLFGWRTDEVIGRRLPEVVKTEYVQASERAVMQYVRDNGYWKGEVIQTRKDGSTINALISLALLEGEPGDSSGFVIVSHDVTERKRAEAQALELVMEKERVRLLREFISDASHDLKTPLAAMHTSLYLLKKDRSAPPEKYLDRLETQLWRLGRLVDDLLTMSRLDDAAYEFELAPLGLNALLSEIVTEQALGAAKQSLSLALTGDDDTPSTLADRAELKRALANLVENAVRYTPVGGRVSLRAFRSGNFVVAEVSDTGIGISPADLPHIFDRFYRADSARVMEKGGTGLGLSIARKIAEAHGGRIEVESALGKGSTFRLYLPCM